MYLSKFFSETCFPPIFLLSKSESLYCNKIEGIFTNIILIIIISIIYTILSFKNINVANQIKSSYIFYLILFILIAYPFFSYYSGNVIWNGYNNLKNILLHKNYNEREILNLFFNMEDKSSLIPMFEKVSILTTKKNEKDKEN